METDAWKMKLWRPTAGRGKGLWAIVQWQGRSSGLVVQETCLEKVCGAERGNDEGGPEELSCTSPCMLGEGIHLAIDGNRPEV